MSDEPLFCIVCGAEDWSCNCNFDPSTDAPPERARRYCETCGVIPAPGKECKFYQAGGNAKGCEAA